MDGGTLVLDCLSLQALPPLMPEPTESRHDFAALYRATVAPLRRMLGRVLRDPKEAEDVAHDAYLRVKPSLDQKTAENPEALLYTTARRLAFNRIKRSRNAPVGYDPLAGDGASAAPGVPQQVMARQELQLLEQAIARLPEGCRSVLLLRKVELLSHQEIADRLGIAISTVEKQHARALRLLRVEFATTTTAGSADQEARS
jgi:RNA polymerase sigma factor (sigma-70 family)